MRPAIIPRFSGGSKDPPGGEIVRDQNGNPTGILKDSATALVSRVMPPLPAAEQDQAMEAAIHEAAVHGVTSVQNLADTPEDESQADVFREFQKYERGGKLTVRIYQGVRVRDWTKDADPGVRAPFGSSLMRSGNLKAFADGALGSETAWMDEPFANNPSNHGLASPDLLDVEKFYGEMRAADKAGLQLTIHAIGDRAIRTILDLYARLEQDNGPADRRPRTVHW